MLRKFETIEPIGSIEPMDSITTTLVLIIITQALIECQTGSRHLPLERTATTKFPSCIPQVLFSAGNMLQKLKANCATKYDL